MTRFERGSVLWTSLLTALTGVGYFWTKYLVESSEPWAVINHPWQPWLLKAHILVAPLMVFAIGMIAVRHVWKHFRGGMRLARRSGVSMALSLAPMVLTGYLIQAITGETLLRAMAISHIALGALFSLALAVHYLRVRRRPEAGLAHQMRRVRLSGRQAPAPRAG